MATKIEKILHPAAEHKAQKFDVAVRLPNLEGLTVGLIDNHKRNANVYLEEVGRLLKARYGVASTITYRKQSQSMPTPVEVIDDLAARCNAIVHGVAD
jgi:hypothetical protein